MQMTRRYQILLALWVASFFIFGDIRPPTIQAEGENRVEVAIRNFAYEVQGSALPPGAPATLILRNTDKVEHGFISLFFQEIDVQVESGGATTFGRGIKGVHIAPGGEVQIRFIPPRPGRITFTCDLHPQMKGEVLLLSVGAA